MRFNIIIFSLKRTMVDKLLNKATLAGNNWWRALRAAGQVRGHAYYEIPKEIKYRYPAPGSCPLDRNDHPNLFKEHWKQPFRGSIYNIRPIEKKLRDEGTERFIAEIPTFDPSASEADRI